MLSNIKKHITKKGNIYESLKESFIDQFGNDEYIFTCYLRVTLDDGICYDNMYYFSENNENAIFYLDVGYNHEIKIIPKNKIIVIEPVYESDGEFEVEEECNLVNMYM